MLKAMKLTARKIEKKRVEIVDLGMNERRGDGLRSGMVQSVHIRRRTSSAEQAVLENKSCRSLPLP